MVKRSVVRRPSKKSPKKQLKRKSPKKKGKKSRGRKSKSLNLSLTSRVKCNVDTMGISAEDNISNGNAATTAETVLNCENNSQETSKSIIILDETISDEGNVLMADQSCFIIDVEPSNDVERSLSKFKDDKRWDGKQIEAVTVVDNCSTVDSWTNARPMYEPRDPLLPDEESSCSSESSGSKSHDESNFICDSLNVGAASNPVNVRNNFDVHPRMNFNNKRSHINETASSNKRLAFDSGKCKPENWNVYKKMISEKTSPSALGNFPKSTSKMCRSDREENEGTDEAFNKSEKDISCICLDDDSDSDIEFVEAFNPGDCLIELSDDEDSIVIENVIPLPSVIPLAKISNNKKKKKKKKKKPSSLLQSDKPDEQKEKKKVKEGAKSERVLRPIVIDGCNVGHGHGRNGKMSVEGLMICYEYFHSRGHDVKVFLPTYKKYHPLTSNVPLLVDMEKQGIAIFTPGRTVNGKKINSYDDRFIVEYATLKGAIIITRDYYRDLYEENEEFRDTITNRLLQYTFVDDLIMFPNDPLGRTGPRLDEFLCFSDSSQDSSKDETDANKINKSNAKS